MTTTAIDIHALAACALFAAGPREPRTYLHGVCLTVSAGRATYVATDGVSLLAIRRDAPDAGLSGEWIIPTDVIRDLGAPKPGDLASLSKVNDDWMEIAYRYQRRAFQPIKERYVDWRAIVPREAKNIPAAYNPDFLVRMRKAARLGGLGEVQMTQNGEYYPAVFTFDVAGEDALGLVMPLRRTDKARPYREKPVIPSWAVANV